MHPSFRQTVIQIICIFYCTCLIYHTLTIWLSTLEDVTYFHHHSHNVHISFGDLGAGWVCQYSIESYVESYYMTHMRKKIPHKNLREKSLSMSCENRNCILLCHKKGVGRSEGLPRQFPTKIKTRSFPAPQSLHHHGHLSIKTVESKGLKIKSVWWTTLLLSRKVCVCAHHHHPTQVLGFRV